MSRKQPRWHIRSGSICEFVYAPDQWAAWDTLRERSIYDFGLIAVAEPDESGEDNAFLVRTSALMFRWGRDDDAKRFIEAAQAHGMPDTTEADRDPGRNP